MLVRLFAENYGPFRDGFDLSMEALNLSAEGDRGFFEMPVRGEDQPIRLLRMAAIYGPNASGKSSIIRAADALYALAIDSGPRSKEDDPLEMYDPFGLDPACRNQPCTLGCEVVVDGEDGQDAEIVRYEISFDGVRVHSEAATAIHGDHADLLFRRDGDSMEFSERVKPHLSVPLGKVTRSNASILSVASQLKQEPLLPLYRAIRNAVRTINCSTDQHGVMSYTLRQLQRQAGFKSWVMQRLLRPADVGVVGIDVQEVDPKLVEDELLQFARKRMPASMDPDAVRFVEPVLTHKGPDDEVKLDFEQESSGTQKLLALAGPWFDVIRKGYCVFVDELSASLHPALLMSLLEAFNAPRSSPRAQIVFTVHDTTLLEGVLRRDQVFFTEKNDEGVSTIFPLSDFHERQNGVHNLRKRYLEGRYGGVPRGLDFGSLFEVDPD